MLQRQGFIEQEGESRLLKRGDLGEEVMVTEDREAFRVEEGDQPPHRRERAVEGTVDLGMIITGQDDGIVVNGRHHLGDSIHDPVIEIAVEVGELEETEPLEGLRETRDHGLMLLDAEIEDVPQTRCTESAGGHGRADHGIHREKALHGKGAESLRHLPAAESLLKVEAPGSLFITQTLTNSLGDALVRTAHENTISYCTGSSNQEIRDSGTLEQSLQQLDSCLPPSCFPEFLIQKI